MISRLNHRIKQQKRSEKQLNTTCAKIAKKLYKFSKPLKYMATFILLIIPYVTKPQWCVEKFKGTEDYENCGFNRDFMSSPDYDPDTEFETLGYPSSRIKKLDPVTMAIFDLSAISTLLFFTNIRLFLKKTTKTAIIRSGILSLFLTILAVDDFLTIFAGRPRYTYHEIISFLILMFFIRSLRESWKRILIVIWDSKAIMIIIFSYMVFYALLGSVLFTGP